MKTILTFTFALALAACGGSSTHTETSTDMAGPHTGTTDLAMTTTGSTDMAMATASAGCAATIMCENQCITTGGTATVEMNCITACDNMESTQGKMLEAALQNCVAMACPESPEDAGTTAVCAYDPSTGAFINPTACDMCQMTAQSSGGTCYSANMACNANT